MEVWGWLRSPVILNKTMISPQRSWKWAAEFQLKVCRWRKTKVKIWFFFLLTNTYSEGSAFFNNSRQLRQADVDGQVPRLPVEIKYYTLRDQILFIKSKIIKQKKTNFCSSKNQNFAWHWTQNYFSITHFHLGRTFNLISNHGPWRGQKGACNALSLHSHKDQLSIPCWKMAACFPCPPRSCTHITLANHAQAWTPTSAPRYATYVWSNAVN